ncbi:MAG: GNAT family N-acetyltransferase [Aliarcobacter sp.]|nr:GNAT family N-acetyltransferase [Aliarcobacter sp.]
MQEVILLSKCSSQQFDKIYAIYEKSFPLSEQKSKEFFRTLFEREDYSIFICQNQDEIEGFTIFYTPLILDFILLEYMAINGNIRSKGLGSKLFQYSISQLHKFDTKPILIEIDSTKDGSKNYEINNKRADFYRKNSCKIVENFDYILGLKSEYRASKMELMVYFPNEKHIEKKSLKRYIQEIYSNVYNRSHDDEDIEKMFENLDENLILN